MSARISSIPAAGLMHSPPVSKVMPLPTNTTGSALIVPCQRSTTRRGRCTDPPPTASNPSNPARRRAWPFKTSIRTPASANGARRSTKRCGVSVLDGSATRSRANVTPAKTAACCRHARRNGGSASVSTTSRVSLALPLMVRSRSYLQVRRQSPVVNATACCGGKRCKSSVSRRLPSSRTAARAPAASASSPSATSHRPPISATSPTCPAKPGRACPTGTGSTTGPPGEAGAIFTLIIRERRRPRNARPPNGRSAARQRPLRLSGWSARPSCSRPCPRCPDAPMAHC